MTAVSVFRGFSFLSLILLVSLAGASAMAEDSPRAVRAVPHDYELSQNFPNPFNPATTIRYAIPVKAHVTLTVHNLLGQVVATIVNGEQEAGFHEIKFDASNLASGVYLYRLESGKFVETRKLTFIK